MPAPVNARSPCLTSPSIAAPRRWPCARAGGPTPCWAGRTPTTPRVLTRLRSAAPAAAVPCLPAPQSRTRQGDPRRPAHGRDAAHRWGRSSPALDVAPPGPLGSRAVRAEVLSRDDPNSAARPQAVLEEGQEASGTGRSGAAAGLCRAASGCVGRRSTRPARLDLRRRGAHPPRRGPRLRLGRARPASLGFLPLAGPVRAGFVLWAVSLQ